jgi:toxin HigB-1
MTRTGSRNAACASAKDTPCFRWFNVASEPSNMNIPGWGLHPLKGKLSGHWSASVSGNWRLTFAFKDGDVELVDYQDCH